MILLLTPLRLCRLIKYPTIVPSVVYSAYPATRVKRHLREEPWITVPENSRDPLKQVGVLKPSILSPPETVLDEVFTNDLARGTTNSSPGKVKKDNVEQEWKNVELDCSKLTKHCLMLSKIRLTSLVVITTMGGYALAPGGFDPQTFLMCSIGTGLVSATANSINQFFEVPFDSQMSRTKNRVLVRGHLTPAHAIAFATVSGLAGISLLYFQVNGLTAALGAANLILYTMIYTPMKRVSILNTWVGSVVGAIPPLMGWAGCMGDIMSPGAWIMSGMLYAWQFPHFNALSWNLRPDYSRAGYRMMAVTNPGLCRRTALRYTALLTALSYVAPALEVTNWWFAIASTPLNVNFLYLAWQFNKNSDSASSRKLFRFSLIHLPVLMILMLCSKKAWTSKAEKNELTKTLYETETSSSILENMTRIFSPTSA